MHLATIGQFHSQNGLGAVFNTQLNDALNGVLLRFTISSILLKPGPALGLGLLIAKYSLFSLVTKKHRGKI